MTTHLDHLMGVWVAGRCHQSQKHGDVGMHPPVPHVFHQTTDDGWSRRTDGTERKPQVVVLHTRVTHVLNLILKFADRHTLVNDHATSQYGGGRGNARRRRDFVCYKVPRYIGVDLKVPMCISQRAAADCDSLPSQRAALDRVLVRKWVTPILTARETITKVFFTKSWVGGHFELAPISWSNLKTNKRN